jgi:hypothetical protein
MTPGQKIDRLDRRVQEMKVEYERFFNGALDVPPDRLRERIGKELRALRRENLKSVEDNFRLANLEARYNSYCELLGRRVRAQEEGLTSAGRQVGPRPAADLSGGLVVEGTVEDEALEALYRGLHHRSGTKPRFDLESFRVYLDRQVSTIRQKTGCARVVFRIAEEDGKMKLKPKPVRQGR